MPPAPSSRPPTRRLPSGGWSRLRAPQLDPLEAYGLASKGETRLLDPKTQESYFRLIISRYMSFCATSGAGLEAAFAGMALAPDLGPILKPAAAPPAPPLPASGHPELALLLSAMRKLREGLVAARRRDGFAQRAYLFVLRAALLMRVWEAYVPCLSALLGLHGVTPLPPGELREVVGYAVLDAACRCADLGLALQVRRRWMARGVRLTEADEVLFALLRDDWLLWRDVQGRVDGYGRAMMGFAEARMRLHVLKVVGRAYMRIELGVLEEWTGMEWDGLVKEGVGWERDGDWVVVKRAKKP